MFLCSKDFLCYFLDSDYVIPSSFPIVSDSEQFSLLGSLTCIHQTCVEPSGVRVCEWCVGMACVDSLACQSSPTFMWALLSSRDVRVWNGLEEVWLRRRDFQTNEGTVAECSQGYRGQKHFSEAAESQGTTLFLKFLFFKTGAFLTFVCLPCSLR